MFGCGLGRVTLLRDQEAVTWSAILHMFPAQKLTREVRTPSYVACFCWLNECPNIHPEHPCDVLRICHLFRYFLTIKSVGIILKDIVGLNFIVIQNGEP